MRVSPDQVPVRTQAGRRLRACRRLVARYGLMLFLAGAGRGLATPAEEVADQPLSSFDRLVLALGEAETGERVSFARSALGALVEVYIAEVDLARSEMAADPDSNRDSAVWVGAVDAYVERLLELLAGLEGEVTPPVQLFAPVTAGGVLLQVAGQQIILDHPRQAQQEVYEQLVLADFCSARDCRRLLKANPAQPAQPIPVTAQAVPVSYNFTAGGSACSARGVTLEFAQGYNIARVRDICAQFHAELAALELEVRWQGRRGVVPEWDSMSLGRRADRPGHVLQLNRAGDAVLLPLPLLAGSDSGLKRITPWLRERLAGGNPELKLFASDLGWSAAAD